MSSTVQGIGVRAKGFFFYLEIKGKLTGLSNQFEPSMAFDPSKFEAPRFDCIHILHTVLDIYVYYRHDIILTFHNISINMIKTTIPARTATSIIHHFISSVILASRSDIV